MDPGARELQTFHAGYVAIIGRPNVGKSTLMNALIGQKISIVTPKPQTTRHKILGILTRPDSQIIFLDTPGLLKPKYLLHQSMMKAAQSAVSDADLVIVMIDAGSPGFPPDKENDVLWELLRSVKAGVFLVINKTDTVKKGDIIPMIAYFDGTFPFREIFPVSALKQSGTEELLQSIIGVLPVHPAYYPADIVSEQSERFFVSEIIREKIFEHFRDEIPYSTAVNIVEFTEQAGKKDVIRADIIVERQSQKGMLIGREGRALKEVGEQARKEIESFLNRKVFIDLRVKVKEKWRKSTAWLKRFGYEA